MATDLEHTGPDPMPQDLACLKATTGLRCRLQENVTPQTSGNTVCVLYTNTQEQPRPETAAPVQTGATGKKRLDGRS